MSALTLMIVIFTCTAAPGMSGIAMWDEVQVDVILLTLPMLRRPMGFMLSEAALLP